MQKKLTTRKLFGKYFHQLTIHAPIQYRIISGNSFMCENQERTFHLCKDITKKTSSNHPGHIIGNLVLRYQIEKKLILMRIKHRHMKMIYPKNINVYKVFA